MQITLKQSDIEQSLKDYIIKQGIRTDDKDVLIAFTAGRRGTGVTAEISIEDAKANQEKVYTREIVLEQVIQATVQEEETTILPPDERVLVPETPVAEPGLVPAKSVSLFG